MTPNKRQSNVVSPDYVALAVTMILQEMKKDHLVPLLISIHTVHDANRDIGAPSGILANHYDWHKQNGSVSESRIHLAMISCSADLYILSILVCL